MIKVFPFLVSATKKEDFRELVLPDFLGKDDKYAFSRITPGHGRTNDTIYSRKVKLQDGSVWRVFQNSFQTDSLDHVGRNIPRIEGFFVPESEADQVEISKETFAEIRLKLTSHFLAAQKWDREHPTTVLSEPWQLKPGHQEVDEVLPDLDIRQEVDAFHASAEETKRQEDLDIHQEEVDASHSSVADARPPRDLDIRQEVDACHARPEAQKSSRDNMGSAKPDAGQAFIELLVEGIKFGVKVINEIVKPAVGDGNAAGDREVTHHMAGQSQKTERSGPRAVKPAERPNEPDVHDQDEGNRDEFSQPSSKGSGKDPSKRDERDPD